MSSATSAEAPAIRQATVADLAQIVELLERQSLPTIGVKESLSRFLVAHSGSEIVGVIGLEACGDRYALLRSAAIADEWKGRGLGTQLVERAVAAAERDGIRALYLLTTTAETYFPRFGFARIQRDDAPPEIKATDEFTSACPASAAVMTRRLGASE